MEWLKKTQDYLLGVVIAISMVWIVFLGLTLIDNASLYSFIIINIIALMAIGVSSFIKTNSLIIGFMLGGLLTFFFIALLSLFRLSSRYYYKTNFAHFLGICLISFVALVAIIVIRKKIYGYEDRIYDVLLGITVAIVLSSATAYGVAFFNETHKPRQIDVSVSGYGKVYTTESSQDRARNDKIDFLLYSVVAFVAIVSGIIFLKIQISSLFIGLILGGIIQFLIGLFSYQFHSSELRFIIFLAFFVILICAALLIEKRRK